MGATLQVNMEVRKSTKPKAAAGPRYTPGPDTASRTRRLRKFRFLCHGFGARYCHWIMIVASYVDIKPKQSGDPELSDTFCCDGNRSLRKHSITIETCLLREWKVHLEFATQEQT